MASAGPLPPSDAASEPPTHRIADHEGGIHFTPPLYRQRYQYALELIDRDPTLHSLLDIGCGPGQLLCIGKYRNPHIQLVGAIDIVRYELDEACFRLKPLPVEYMIFRRDTPLHMYVVHGDASKSCNCFHNFDVVTLIEVIEHLYPDDLVNLARHVFAYIRPRLVIVTTPNSDFNVLFPSMPCGQFRHADHKFEFTRQEFNAWAQQIALSYHYSVTFDGVGEAPASEQHRNIGCCTQIAIFARQESNREGNLHSNELSRRLSHCNQHEVVGFIDYPYGVTKITELDEQVRYILEMYRLMAQDKARRGDDNHDKYPLTVTCAALLDHPRLIPFQVTVDELKQTVDSVGYKMADNDRIILVEEPPTHPREHDSDNEQRPSIGPDWTSDRAQADSQTEESWD